MSAIRFDHITLDYGSRPVLGDVSFALGAGSFTGVLGPNGAGKSSVMRAILGLLAPSRGRIEVLGAPVRRGAARLGYLPQQARLDTDIRLSVEAFLLSAAAGLDWCRPIASRRRRQEVAAALDGVGASALAARRIGDLSGGERQRVLIAQTLIGDPAILILDEPLASLDPGHQRTIVDLVAQIARQRGITVLFSAHDINPILPAVDNVLYLGRSKAVVGPVEKVVTGAVLSDLYGTPIHVARSNGRVFVLAADAGLDGTSASYAARSTQGHVS